MYKKGGKNHYYRKSDTKRTKQSVPLQQIISQYMHLNTLPKKRIHLIDAKTFHIYDNNALNPTLLPLTRLIYIPPYLNIYIYIYSNILFYS